MKHAWAFKALFINVSLLVSLLIFSRGFLPPTHTTSGFAETRVNVPAKFQRLIFVVIDAMRSDFLYSEPSMENVHQLLRDGFGYAFTAHSDPPTVTLPRLKGLTTGASPNFLDAVINIAESDSASTLENQDSWIHQLKAQKKTIHMFGDDTWVKLFPKTFDKVDGTSSFYVADFTEVDQNVTRHLPEELYSEDPKSSWDCLILHYLGLDHIGHKGGPNSVHMPGKLREMDSVIKTLFDSLDNSTLLVLAGDHGMNDVGNHGGASIGETSAALAFFAKTFDHKIASPLASTSDYHYYSKVQQVDVVPTLALLLGFPIPKNSLGVFMESFLPLWASTEERNAILESNCQMLHLQNEECNWQALRESQEYLKRNSSEHKLELMLLGIALLFIVSLFSAYSLVKEVSNSIGHHWSYSLIFWIVFPVMYFIGMMGSSTVEEEHYIWYWWLCTIIGFFVIVLPDFRDKIRSTLLLACFRVMRGWNSAGQKWNFLTDSATLVGSDWRILWPLVAFTFIVAAMQGKAKFGVASRLLSVMAAAAVFAFKVFSVHHSSKDPVMLTLAWCSAGLSLCDILVGSGSQSGSLLILILQTKTENIPIWITAIMARLTLESLVMSRSQGSIKRFSDTEMSVISALAELCFEYASFFALGGSNSMATVDLSNSYNGVTGYNIPLVALLTYLGNWSLSLYWFQTAVAGTHRILRSWFYSMACFGVALACLVLREHLFIWTVFSPKLLYVVTWLALHEVVAMGILGKLLYSN